MDEMKIVSGFTTTLVSKLLRFALRKKLGYDIHIQLNAIEAIPKAVLKEACNKIKEGLYNEL